MGRRILITLLLGGLGAAAWWMMAGRETGTRDTLVVDVRVVDQAGKPLGGAQVEPVFAPGWKVVDRDGTRRLSGFPLREGEAPSADALAAAVRVRARFYSLRSGHEPEIERRADGSWAMRYALHHHGVLRLHVGDTHLGRPKAFLESDAPLQRWEAMDRGNVARPGAPAAFRIYPGFDEVAVRLAGEPDASGDTGIATRRFFFEPPSPGHVVEKTLVPDAAQPILGTVLPPEGPAPPSLAGRVFLRELSANGRVIEREPVRIEDDGRFIARTVGAGRYVLRVACDFLEPFPEQTVSAGDVVDVEGGALRPWLAIQHPPIDRTGQYVQFLAVGGADAAVAEQALPAGPERTLIPLAGIGLHLLRIWLGGSAKEPPREVERWIPIDAPGPTDVQVTFEERPHGTLVVRAAPAALARAGGATVRVGNGVRSATLLPRVAEEARFENVEAQGWTVTLVWRDADAVPESRVVSVRAGETTTLTLPHRPGGRLHLRGAGPAAAVDVRERLLVAPEAAAEGEWLRVRCVRRGPAPTWVSTTALPPGRHRVLLLGDDEPDAELEFTIRAGETTVVPFEVR